MVETSPVNEELQKNFSDLFMQHSTRETVTGQKSFEQAIISTYLIFICGAARAAINFLDQALELGWQSSRSSPESFFTKIVQKTNNDQPPFLLKHEGAWPRKEQRKFQVFQVLLFLHYLQNRYNLIT